MKRIAMMVMLIAAVSMTTAFVLQAADDKAAPAMGDSKTLQGQVVDLTAYLMSRASGDTMKKVGDAMKDGNMPKDANRPAARDANMPAARDANMPMGGAMTGAKGTSTVKALLVTEKDWLSKITPGVQQELYVILNEPAATGAAAMSKLDVGQKVKITGHVMDYDGVRAIHVMNVEPASAAK